MRPLRFSIAALLLLASFLRNTPVHAAWPSSPIQNVALCTAPGDQSTPALVSDGAGGAIVTWSDARNGPTDIYVQRVSSTGAPLWTADGVPICTAAGNQSVPKIISDGAGGAIVTWVDSRSGNVIYAQRVDAAGVAQWTANGVAISVAAGNHWIPELVSDGSGGAIVTWGDGGIVSGNSNDILAQRVNAAGALQGPVVAICTGVAGVQSFPAIASDGANGAIVTWKDFRVAGNPDIYAQRVNAAGVVQWTANGVVLCTDGNIQDPPEIVSDGAGGAVVAWKDFRAPVGVYAQRVNASGTPQWLANGVQATDDTNPLLGMVSDGASGAIINSGVKASRVHANGALLWGLGVSTFGGSLLIAGPLVADGTGGAIVAGATTDIYGQHLNASGAQLWTTSGSPICTAAGTQSSPAIDSDGAGGAIIAWADPRNNGVSTDIFAQRISASGYIGNPPEPSIVKVRDAPNDQGGKVSVSWNASGLDLESAPTINEYWIWRQAPSAFALQALSEDARLLAGVRTGGEPTRRLFRLTTEAGHAFYWEFVGSQVARGFDGYSYTAPTLSDSVGGSNPLTRFMVEAVKLSSGEGWSSAPDSGYSVDNLPPVVPGPFLAKYSGGATNLHWAPNTEGDLAGYRVYRGSSESFVPGPGNLISAQPDTGYVDPGPAGNYYKLSSMDVHGNESLFALITPSTTADVPGSDGFALSLARAVPNPATGAVSFRFSLPREGRATLTVYDQQGRSVRELVKGTLPAGEQGVNWNGRDDAGREVTPGIYFYRLQIAGRMLVQRVVMVR